MTLNRPRSGCGGPQHYTTPIPRQEQPAQAPQSPCVATILNAINKQFGTNLTSANLVPLITSASKNDMPADHFLRGGGINIYVQATNLTQTQFNSMVPGRYPTTSAGTLGPNLFIFQGTVPRTETAIYQQNIDSQTNSLGVTFTAHLDSADPVDVVGAIDHLFTDVFQINRDPCPTKGD